MFDLLIVGGRVVDGTGNPWYYGDVGVWAGRIAAIGKLEGAEAARVVDAAGMVVSPGFIDIHTHADLAVMAEPRMDLKVRQGVTTEVVGLCGFTFAPISPPNMKIWRWYNAAVFGQPELDYSWSTVGQYLERVDGRAAVNVVSPVGHCPVRAEAMGWDRRLATPDELEAMKRLVAQAMEEGAIGFSTGLDYAPALWCDTHELVELCRVVARYGGVFLFHMRHRLGDRFLDPIREAIEIGERSGVAVHISHFKAGSLGRADEALALLDAARGRGVDVTVESYTYLAGSGSLHASLPDWAHEGGPGKLTQRLADPAMRAHMKQQPPRTAWDRAFLSHVPSPERKHYEGQTVGALAEAAGQHPLDFACDLLLAENLEVCQVGHGGHEGDIRRILAYDAHMVGSDSVYVGDKRHPRAFGCFPRLLGRYVRELKVLSLEECVRKMSGAPAARLKLGDRGLIKTGMAADLVVFNPDTVLDTATFAEPLQYPVGVEYVAVNGDLVVDAGRHTGALPGRALKLRA